MSVRHLASAVAASISLQYGAAVAQSTPEPAPPPQLEPANLGEHIELHFTQLDRNSDGLISRDEARSHPAISNKFDQLDRNTDGNLSPAEFSLQTAAVRRHGVAL